ncbi:MAG: alpha/beta hydrolase [Proteobacteria bacterium]|nr:MAG: alpha/beta hydrolase [Pseudomonadota bacterium]
MDGAKLTLDFYPPSGDQKTSDSAPWVLVIHGGGWQSGDSAQLAPLNSYLARRGYGVVAINYRHAPAHQWPSQREDAVSAIKFVEANAKDWNLNSRRYAILGRSAGAQIAGAVAYGIGSEPGMESPKALVSFYGPTDMAFAYDNSKPGDVLEPIRLLEDFLGGKPSEQQVNYQSASPMELAKKSSCPTLLLHGTEDPIVRVQHSRRLEARLKKLGVPVSFIELPWATHGFDFFFHGPGGQISTNAVEDFLAKTLKHDVKK